MAQGSPALTKPAAAFPVAGARGGLTCKNRCGEERRGGEGGGGGMGWGGSVAHLQRYLSPPQLSNSWSKWRETLLYSPIVQEPGRRAGEQESCCAVAYLKDSGGAGAGVRKAGRSEWGLHNVRRTFHTADRERD